MAAPEPEEPRLHGKPLDELRDLLARRGVRLEPLTIPLNNVLQELQIDDFPIIPNLPTHEVPAVYPPFRGEPDTGLFQTRRKSRSENMPLGHTIMPLGLIMVTRVVQDMKDALAYKTNQPFQSEKIGDDDLEVVMHVSHALDMIPTYSTTYSVTQVTNFVLEQALIGDETDEDGNLEAAMTLIVASVEIIDQLSKVEKSEEGTPYHSIQGGKKGRISKELQMIADALKVIYPDDNPLYHRFGPHRKIESYLRLDERLLKEAPAF